ncbi:hypothetical protein AB0G60_20535 [Streptomyces angustmyceticus]|uniref:Uncharacterized protein n=1 Tax=Streptomyces angustmyceticus TaxID=285578 RepID=A0A5J4L702_9ACTN|nr:hypothetical protein [Streptomyces angustmyceticus]UAL66632.1 hypothetical protein K7396_08860 [Streptomyces angustmyceticus]GES28514.1 hypothetical protein San01_10010 [Streptomyces angustmyceticus]
MRVRLITAAVTLSVALGGTVLAAPAAQAAAHRAPVATVAKAAAPGFNVGGIWTLYQSNAWNATLSVTQDAQGNLTGIARTGSATTGTIEQGFVDGSYVSFVIAWNNGTKGRYIGSRGADGRLSGVASQVGSPSNQATWYTTWTF